MRLLVLILPLIATTLTAMAPKGELPDPKLTEDWGTPPPNVIPQTKRSAPSDAIVLFDEDNLDAWISVHKEKEGPAHWIVDGDEVTVNTQTRGSLQTKDAFGDCQLHLEWRTPAAEVEEGKTGQGLGNSGIFLMGRYEIQVLNSYKNETYINGMAGSIYKQHVPLVNASTPAGTWQTYDIIFKAPRFKRNGKLESPAYVTVLHNGILIQNNVEIKGATHNRLAPK